MRVTATVCSTINPMEKRENDMAELKITSENFTKAVTQSELPVLVDFYADWCGPCKMLAPILHEIAAEHQSSLRVAKINVDEAPELAGHFNVSSIPTLLYFRGGQLRGSSLGFMEKEELEQKLKEWDS